MREYFPKLKSFRANVKVELDLSNYATKSDLIYATGVNKSSFAKKVDLVNLISNADELDIDKLKIVPSGLSKSKSKKDKLDIGKVETTPINLSKLNDAIEIILLEKMYITLGSKILTIKHLILLS